MLKSETRIHFNKHIKNFRICSGFPIDQEIIHNIGPLVKLGGGGEGGCIGIGPILKAFCLV